MKKVLAVLLTFASVSLFAGPKLGDKITEMLNRIDSCASADMVGSIVKEYEDIIVSYGADWRSYYWMAYGNLKKAEYCFDEKKREQALDAGLKFIERARMLKLQHAETDILEAMLLQQKINIDPQNRENKYGYLVRDLLANAYKLDQLNPRYYLIKGISTLNDTVANPGNKKQALDFLLSAEKLYGPHDKGADEADPTWGFDETQAYLNVLAPNRTTYYNRKGEVVKSLLDAEADSEMADIEKQLKKEQKQREKELKKQRKKAVAAVNAEDGEEGSDKKSETKEEKSKKDKKDKEEEKKEKKKKPKKVRNLP